MNVGSVMVSTLVLFCGWMLVALRKESKKEPVLTAEEMRDEVNTW